MAQIHNWNNGMPQEFNRRERGRQRAEDEVEVTALYMRNVPGTIKVVIARESGEMMDLPDDGLVLLFVTKEAATRLRDDLLDPNDFPDTLE